MLGMKQEQRRVWSEEDHAFLVENWGKMPIDDIAAALGRSRPSVQGYAQTHGTAIIGARSGRRPTSGSCRTSGA